MACLEKDRLCNVCIDEMSLKCGLHYNVSKDMIDGFVNMDCGGSQEISKQALVFMATGLASNWKQPIGFFLVKTTASAHVLKTLLSECLTRLFDIGLCVKSVIFDQGASNQKLVKLLQSFQVEGPQNREISLFLRIKIGRFFTGTSQGASTCVLQRCLLFILVSRLNRTLSNRTMTMIGGLCHFYASRCPLMLN